MWMFPEKKIMAGCYLWNFGNDAPLTIRYMENQCGVALDFLNDGIIDDIIIPDGPLIGTKRPTTDGDFRE